MGYSPPVEVSVLVAVSNREAREKLALNHLQRNLAYLLDRDEVGSSASYQYEVVPVRGLAGALRQLKEIQTKTRGHVILLSDRLLQFDAAGEPRLSERAEEVARENRSASLVAIARTDRLSAMSVDYIINRDKLDEL